MSFAIEDKKTDTIVKYVIGKSVDSSYQNYTKLYQKLYDFSKCIQETDFWAVEAQYGSDRLNYGIANGVYRHCLEETAIENSCIGRSIMDTALSARHNLRVLEKPSDLDISGHGAVSQEVIFIGDAPKKEEGVLGFFESGGMSVVTYGHSKFFYLVDAAVGCTDGYFGGCRLSPGLPRSCLSEYKVEKSQ